MRGITLFFLSALILVFLGWMFPEWLLKELASIPYYTETATEIQKIHDEKLVGYYDSFLKQPHMWLLENIWTVAGGYALASVFLVGITKDRSVGWGYLWFVCLATVVLSAWLLGGMWLSVASGSISDAYLPHAGRSIISWLITLSTGLLALFLMLALVATFWIGIPIYVLFVLLLLPNALYALLRGAILLPVILWHHLHYLFVPHPAEGVYREGIANNLPMEELASVVSEAMYTYDHGDLDALPPAWRSRNQKKRADAFKDLVNAEGPLMEAIMANLEMKDKLRERRRTTDV